ncbi:MAG: hypothetical protein ACI4FZ_02150 [Lachnospiraceae bacterium]
MKQEVFFEALGDMDDKYIQEAKEEDTGKKHTRKKNEEISWRKGWKWIPLAACLCLLLGAGTYFFGGRRIELSEASQGVTVRYVNRAPKVYSEACLIYLSEEEIFTWQETLVVKGTVVSIENIKISFNGDKSYRAIAEIKVEKVYRGDCEEGDIVTALLPRPVGNGTYMTTMDTLEALKVGMTGIFMPTVYDETSIWGQNGATLCLKDIADYGFADGVRFAFLETEDGLLFDRHTFESIKDAVTLEEIEAYVTEMIERVKQ